jgi:hypothetical protein
MKNMIFLILLAFGTSFAKEAFLDPYWTSEAQLKSDEKPNLKSIENFIDNVTDSDLEALNSVNLPERKGDDKNHFYFGGMETSLALGFSGGIGIWTFGGTKVIEVDWERKRTPGNKSQEEETSGPETITVNENTTKMDLQKELEPFIRALVDSKKINDEKELRKNLTEASGNFLAYAKGMNASETHYHWIPRQIRLEFNIEATGKIAIHAAPVLVKLGSLIKLRLQFLKVKPACDECPKGNDSDPATEDMTETEKKIARQTKSLLDKLSEEVTLAYEEQVKENNMEKHGVRLTDIEVGLGLQVEGNVGVASLKGNVIPSVFLGKVKDGHYVPVSHNKADDEDTILIESSGESTADKSLRDRIRNRMAEVKRKVVRKGMKKAIDFAYLFADKIKSRSLRHPNSRWCFKHLESKYNFSIAGGFTPVKVSLLPIMTLIVDNYDLK